MSNVFFTKYSRISNDFFDDLSKTESISVEDNLGLINLITSLLTEENIKLALDKPLSIKEAFEEHYDVFGGLFLSESDIETGSIDTEASRVINEVEDQDEETADIVTVDNAIHISNIIRITSSTIGEKRPMDSALTFFYVVAIIYLSKLIALALPNMIHALKNKKLPFKDLFNKAFIPTFIMSIIVLILTAGAVTAVVTLHQSRFNIWNIVALAGPDIGRVLDPIGSIFEVTSYLKKKFTNNDVEAVTSDWLWLVDKETLKYFTYTKKTFKFSRIVINTMKMIHDPDQGKTRKTEYIENDK